MANKRKIVSCTGYRTKGRMLEFTFRTSPPKQREVIVTVNLDDETVHYPPGAFTVRELESVVSQVDSHIAVNGAGTRSMEMDKTTRPRADARRDPRVGRQSFEPQRRGGGSYGGRYGGGYGATSRGGATGSGGRY